MALSSKDLSRSIDPDDVRFTAFLKELQGNILKGHGRELTANIFLRFPAKSPTVVAALGRIARERLTSAADQLGQSKHFRATGQGGGTVLFMFLTAQGYDALGRDKDKPDGDAFQAGMANRPDLQDPDAAAWDQHLTGVHALILIGHENAKGLDMAIQQVSAILRTAGINILGIEMGRGRFNKHGVGIEHFGYVDGRSQPLLLTTDVAAEVVDPNGGTVHWNPAFSPLDTVLVKDKGGKDADSFGSFFVFRKLEQNVHEFKKKEQKLAGELGLVGGNRERAGAMVVGRFEDGTPLIDFNAPRDTGGVPNDFNYDADPDGLRCPFQAHIRKTNPRGDVQRRIGLPDAKGDRRPIMARRGIPYGVRSDDGEDIDAMPTGGVGLLFMAYQRSLEEQFEFTQKSWANNEGFLPANAPTDPATGLDPVIGQKRDGDGVKQRWRATPDAAPVPFLFEKFVTIKGGDYFFAPSTSFLRSLGQTTRIPKRAPAAPPPPPVA